MQALFSLKLFLDVVSSSPADNVTTWFVAQQIHNNNNNNNNNNYYYYYYYYYYYLSLFSWRMRILWMST